MVACDAAEKRPPRPHGKSAAGSSSGRLRKPGRRPAGAQIAAAAIRAGLVDQIEWFRAPIVLGGDGLPVLAALGLETLGEAPIFRRIGAIERGADLQESYERVR